MRNTVDAAMRRRRSPRYWDMFDIPYYKTFSHPGCPDPAKCTGTWADFEIKQAKKADYWINKANEQILKHFMQSQPTYHFGSKVGIWIRPFPEQRAWAQAIVWSKDHGQPLKLPLRIRQFGRWNLNRNFWSKLLRWTPLSVQSESELEKLGESELESDMPLYLLLRKKNEAKLEREKSW